MIIIIIMSCPQHGSPWSSRTTLLYHPSLLVGFHGYILYQHRTVVYRFLLVVLPLLVHVKESTGVGHLWVRPYFSSSVPHVWFVNSNHRIVKAKIWLNLRRNTAPTTTTVHYDWSLLNNRDIKDKYALILRNKFDALQEKSETHTPNDEYENFVNAYLEAAAECIPTKHGRY